MDSTDRDVVASLGDSGRRLWGSINPSDSLDEAGCVLLLEACRMADRCDRLARLVDGDADEWARVVTVDGVMVMQVGNVVSEARQHASTLARLVTEIRQIQKRSPRARGEATDGGPGGVTDLAARIAAKRSQAAN